MNKKMILVAGRYAVCGIIMLSLGGCSLWHPKSIVSGTLIPELTSPGKVVSLEQGWDQKVQSSFWFTTQGSQILPYRIFLGLEQSGSEELFRSDANILKFGYIPAKPGPKDWNPDGLPIGFAKNVDKNKAEWVGFTCAACHTTQVNYKGVGMLIDGGPGMADFNAFYPALIDAMTHTINDPAKFDRLISRVLGIDATQAQQDALKNELVQTRDQNAARLKRNQPTYETGSARLDAFGNILNEIMVTALNQPNNVVPPDAPVSYPFLWDTPQHDKVQWNGSVSNDDFGVGNLGRNAGEVIGVFGGLTIADCGKDLCKYKHNINIPPLGELESWARSLWSPQWYSAQLGKIDAARANAGQVHYQKNCVGCHAPINRTDSHRTIKAVMRDVGTDPTMATAPLIRVGLTGPLQGTLKQLIPETRFEATDEADVLLSNAVAGALLADPDEMIHALHHGNTLIRLIRTWISDGGAKERVKVYQRASKEHKELIARFKSDPNPAKQDATYKARPLNGIWATAPYLHNGSVPNLWELLQAPDKRVKTFYVGSREFDPKQVGFESHPAHFKFDISVPGNSNSGHSMGTKLTEDEKWELIEYLKTL